MSSCLEFKPCSHYNDNKNNKGNAFTPLFGSSSLSLNRKQRKLNRATSGNKHSSPKSQVLVSGYRLQADKLCFLCVKCFSFYVSLHKSYYHVVMGLCQWAKCEGGFFILFYCDSVCLCVI